MTLIKPSFRHGLAESSDRDGMPMGSLPAGSMGYESVRCLFVGKESIYFVTGEDVPNSF